MTDEIPRMTDTTTPTEGAPHDVPERSNWGGLVIVIALLAFLGLNSLFALGIVLAIVFFVFLHELGHYVTARMTGMKATEFFIGFGPRIWSFRRGETEYGIKPILAGAYVRIIGMNNLEEVDPAEEHRTYRQQSYPRKVLVASAGSLMHFMLAFVLFFISFGIIGIEREDAWTITDPSPDSAAAVAGLERGDRLISVGGVSTDTFAELVDAVVPLADADVDLVFERDDSVITVPATIGSRENAAGATVGFLGVGAEYEAVRDSLPGAAWRTTVEFPDRIWDSLRGIGTFVGNFGGFIDRVFTAPGAETDVADESRPMSVVGLVQVGTQLGTNVVWLLAFFNVFIGVFNLLPLLPLDGG